MNILKAIANQQWGAHRHNDYIYKAIIRSKLDYGSIIYKKAAKTHLKTIDSIHTQALRLSTPTGAFRTSPVISISNLSGEPKLSTRRDQLTLSYFLILAKNSNNPASKLFFITQKKLKKHSKLLKRK